MIIDLIDFWYVKILLLYIYATFQSLTNNILEASLSLLLLFLLLLKK
jgi:hypothetical protein